MSNVFGISEDESSMKQALKKQLREIQNELNALFANVAANPTKETCTTLSNALKKVSDGMLASAA